MVKKEGHRASRVGSYTEKEREQRGGGGEENKSIYSLKSDYGSMWSP